MIGFMKTDVLGRVIINAPLQNEPQGKKPVLQPHQNHIVYTWQRKKNLGLWCRLKLFFIYVVVLKRSICIS